MLSAGKEAERQSPAMLNGCCRTPQRTLGCLHGRYSAEAIANGREFANVKSTGLSRNCLSSASFQIGQALPGYWADAASALRTCSALQNQYRCDHPHK
jgi:hypothetical protein